MPNDYSTKENEVDCYLPLEIAKLATVITTAIATQTTWPPRAEIIAFFNDMYDAIEAKVVVNNKE